MRRIAVVLCGLLVVYSIALGGGTRPKYYFTAKRTLTAGTAQTLTSSNATIRVFPATEYASADTATHQKDAVYQSTPLNQWLFIPDSTNVYIFVEITGADTVIAGMEALHIEGWDLSSVTAPIKTYSLEDSAVTSVKIKDYSIVAADIDTGAVTTTAILDSTILGTDIATEADVTLQDLHADSVWADYAYIDVIGSLTGISTDGAVTANEFNETTGHWWAHADSSWSDMGAWYTNRFKIGSGEATDKLTVDGSISATATISGVGIGSTGAVTATTKMTAADSVCAGISLRSGTPSVAGSIVTSDGSGNVLTETAPAMSADISVTKFSFTAIDSFLCSTGRPLGADRSASKYVPGVVAGDWVMTSFHGSSNGSPLATRVVWYTVTDSVGFAWASNNDGLAMSFMVLRK